MAFGFVVEKFGLFLKQVANFLTVQGLPKGPELSAERTTYSSLFGIFLVSLGTLMVLFAFIRYRKNERQIEEKDFRYSSTLVILMTFLVFIMGIFLAMYLVNT